MQVQAKVDLHATKEITVKSWKLKTLNGQIKNLAAVHRTILPFVSASQLARQVKYENYLQNKTHKKKILEW